MSIKLFNTSSNPQTTKHFSSRRDDVAVIQNYSDALPLLDSEEFCTCIKQCVPCLPMFTDTIGVDPYKNDFYSLFQNSITGGSHEVYIYINGVKQPQVTTNAYGVLFNMTTCYGVWFVAEKIHGLHGYCEWYGELINKDGMGNIVAREVTPCFKIHRFTEAMANRTVRIETQQKGKLLHGKDYSNLVMVTPAKNPGYWRQQIRLPGALVLTNIPVENDGIKLNDPTRTRLQIMDKLTFEYDLHLDLVSADQVLFNVILDYLFAGPVFVTDYNVYSWGKMKAIRLVRTGHDLNPGIAIRKSIVVKMEREESNIEKTND